jgi:hypothetical protein
VANAYGDSYGDVYGSTLAPPPPDPPPGAVAKPIVQIGFSTDPLVGGGLYLHWSDPARLWDVGLWAPDDVWTDVTPWLRSWSFRRGASRVEGPILRYDPGTATIALNNNDGRFNPLNLAGPYVSGGRSQVRPMIPVRIGVDFGDVVYWQYTGYADGWQIDYPSANHGVATVTATDAQKVIGRALRTARTAVGAGEKPGARINRILDSVNWPAADRSIALGETTLQGTTLEGDAWSEMVLVQDTEIGSVYVDAVGKVVFKGRYAILTESSSTTTQGTFGSDIGAGELPYTALSPVYDDSSIRNIWRITRVGGTAQEVRDEASILENREIVNERTDLLMQSDSDALTYAQYGLATTASAQLVFGSIEVDPRAMPAQLFPQVLGRDIGHRITVRSRPPGVGLVERDAYVRGIAGEYGGTGRWKWTWTLQPAAVASYLVWDVGRWDQTAWAF